MKTIRCVDCGKIAEISSLRNEKKEMKRVGFNILDGPRPLIFCKLCYSEIKEFLKTLEANA